MIKNYKTFNESKKKFPNLKKVEYDGFLIYVGRDAASNDHLTFNMADNDDIWLHAKGIPGSHVVIISNNNKLPSESVIKYAAELAKKNSKGKNEKKIEVVFCKRRFVKKDNNMNVGQVRVDYVNSETIKV